MDKITLYTTGCPRCKVLSQKLDAKGIPYEAVTDVDEIIEKGFAQAPVLVVNDDVMEFATAVQWVNEQ